MNFKTGFIALALMGLGAATLAGCGNACDDYADAAQAKLDECGITGGTTDGDGGDVDCSDSVATLAECLTPCIENVPCGALDGSDLDALQTYSDCVGACA